MLGAIMPLFSGARSRNEDSTARMTLRRIVGHWKHHDRPQEHWAVHHPRSLSATRVSFLLLKKDTKLTENESGLKRAILRHCPEIRAAWRIASEFMQMLRQRTGERLKSWFETATRKKVPTSIRRFALGLQTDWKAVVAALTTEWSNGMAEGHVNRLKMIKRQMYGRAKFDLLRTRFIATV